MNRFNEKNKTIISTYVIEKEPEYIYPKLNGYTFYDKMATPEDIQTMKTIRNYDEYFEVTEKGQLDESKAITPFVRSN